MQRPDLVQGRQAGDARPVQEMGDRPDVGGGRVGVADRRGEELQEPLGGVIMGLTDDRRRGEARRLINHHDGGSRRVWLVVDVFRQVSPLLRSEPALPNIKDIMFD